MLHSHSFQERAFDSFASFIRKVLRGENKYEQLVEPIIFDAVSLAKKEKDYYNVRRDSFDVIVFLAEKDPTFLTTLNPDSSALTTDQYQRILDLVTDQREVINA